MEFLCLAVVLAIVVTILGLPIAAAFDAWRAREIWGSVLVRRERVGSGPFRAALTESRKPRSVPPSVWAAAVPGAALAPITGLVFAPAGLLGALIYLSGDASSFPGMVTLAAAADGFVLPFVLFGASRALVLCDARARSKARLAALWSGGHHGLVAVAFGLELHGGVDGAWFALVPAVVGVVHSAALFVAGEEVGRIQRSMTDDERAVVERIRAEMARRDADAASRRSP